MFNKLNQIKLTFMIDPHHCNNVCAFHFFTQFPKRLPATKRA